MKPLNTPHTLPHPDFFWREYVALTVTAVLGLVWLYQETALSLVGLWRSSETYAHGFIIYPISLYLIWSKRAYLSSIAPHPSALATATLPALGIGWIVAQSAGVQVVAQYMFVAMVPVLIASILGLRVARILVFPLAFTLLAVPFGEIFIRPLIDFTADFTVLALNLTGVPVFREGNHLTLTSGNWSVVEACSGLRYLIASFTLGCLYAYLTYRSRLRQIIFILLSIIVPIIANGLRAYMIVMIGHLSNMQLAVGVDHLIYGWVFFGLVMLALFWAGSRWREDGPVAPEKNTTSPPPPALTRVTTPVKATGFAVIALLLAWSSPAYLQHLEQLTFNPSPVSVTLPQTIGPWVASSPSVGLNPRFPGAASTVLQEYRNGNQTIGIYIAFFRNQRNGSEAVSSQNILADEKINAWSVTHESNRPLRGKIEPRIVRESQLRWGNHHMLAWQWYSIGNSQTANPYVAKLLQAKQRFLDKKDDSANIIIFAPYDAQSDEVSTMMENFLVQAATAIRSSLEQAQGK